MRALLLLLGMLVATPAGPARADDPVAYVQKVMEEMVAVSKKPTADRRAFYEGLLGKEVDWTGPAMQALGQRWQALEEPERRKLADWARQSVLAAGDVMGYMQNLILQACAIAGRTVAEDGASVRLNCTRFGGEPNFQARFDVARRGDGFKIVDIHHTGASLREQLSREILKPTAVAEHGVKVN